MLKKQTYLIYIVLFFSAYNWSQNLHLFITSKDTITFKSSHNTFKNTKEIHQHINSLKNNLFNKGYFNLENTEPTKINDSTFQVIITPNKQYKHISIYHNNTFTQKELSKLLSSKTKINQNTFISNITELETNLNQLLKHLVDSGKSFSKLQLQDIEIKNDSVFASLSSNNKKVNTIKNIIIRGYDKFPRKFLKHHLNLKTNKPLNISKLEKKSEQLNNLRFANELKKPELLFFKDSTEVYLYIKKQKANSFDGFLGFSSNQETNKLDFNGNINLQLINNLHTGEELYLKYQATENEQRLLNLRLRTPFLFNSPISIEGELDIFRKDSTFTNNQQKIKAFYQINPNLILGLGSTFSSSNVLENSFTLNEDFKKTAFNLNLEHSKPDANPLFIYKTKTNLTLETGNRKTIESTNQQSIYLNALYNFTLNKRNSIFLQNQSYYLISDDILENESHFIGGINSIRGFQENSIPSNLYSIINTEYRFTLNKTLYLHSVTDYAYTKDQTNNSTNNLFGFGFGFGLQTNNNLLKFVFANSKTNNKAIQLNNSKIHLSLKTIF